MENLTRLVCGDRVAGMTSEGMIDTGTARRWCILRTAGPRTLVLAQSLCAAGLDVWTPTEVIKRRRSRSRAIVEFAVPMMPTFVFANAVHLGELMMIRSTPGGVHPPFSLFRGAYGFPIIADASLGALRGAEDRARARAARDKSKRAVTDFPVGTRVRVARTDVAWTGKIGIVEGTKGKDVAVCFDGRQTVKIASWMLESDVIQEGLIAPLGVAA